jgi:hypothetical protein
MRDGQDDELLFAYKCEDDISKPLQGKTADFHARKLCWEDDGTTNARHLGGTTNCRSNALHQISSKLSIDCPIPRNRLDQLAASSSANSHLAHLRAITTQEVFELAVHLVPIIELGAAVLDLAQCLRDLGLPGRCDLTRLCDGLFAHTELCPDERTLFRREPIELSLYPPDCVTHTS